LHCPAGVSSMFIEALRQSVPGRPPGIPSEGKILGYVGALHQKVDLRCLELLAGHSSCWQVVLIGFNDFRGESLDRFERLVSRSNVHYLGAMPWRRLSDYVRWFDVGLLPYCSTDVSSWCEIPAKLFEYLAAGLPVVEMALPCTNSLNGVVQIAQTPEEFLSRTEKALETDTEADRSSRRELALANTWERRAESVLLAARTKLIAKGWDPSRLRQFSSETGGPE